jgi:hypothetical protein
MELLETRLLNLLESPIKARNEVIDALFYDVGSLTVDEKKGLSPLSDLKGTVLVVPPRAAKDQMIRHYPNPLRFMVEEGDDIEAIAIAGVGSSVLGTAALARNVADHYQCHVAGIVTGYGLADVVVEALGGWFFYGTLDRFRFRIDQGIQALLTPLPSAGTMQPKGVGCNGFVPFPVGSFGPGNSDVGALRDILLARPAKLRLLVGHSKGNLLISFVLNYMQDELEGIIDAPDGRRNPLEGLTVVTLGAVVDIPTRMFKLRTYQFLGEYDLLGQLNSDRNGLGEIASNIPVAGTGHHLNPVFPYAMRVGDVLKQVELPAPVDAGDGKRSLARSWGQSFRGVQRRKVSPAR